MGSRGLQITIGREKLRMTPEGLDALRVVATDETLMHSVPWLAIADEENRLHVVTPRPPHTQQVEALGTGAQHAPLLQEVVGLFGTALRELDNIPQGRIRLVGVIRPQGETDFWRQLGDEDVDDLLEGERGKLEHAQKFQGKITALEQEFGGKVGEIPENLPVAVVSAKGKKLTIKLYE